MDWSESQIQAVWEKGATAGKVNSQQWRKDACGAWICRAHFNDRKSPFGWEIDRIRIEENGKSNELDNLRPLQWKNLQMKKGDELSCPVIANGGLNMDFSTLQG